MKNIRLNKYFYAVLMIIPFFGIQFGYASESFQNNLLKMDFEKSSLGGVKIIFYTSKPYKEPLNVNKKSDLEYVILMPETSNSLTASPILNPVASIVKVVNVKTQQYENQIKGYTKITVATKQPVEIITQSKVFDKSVYNFSDNDYKELLAQTSKNAQQNNNRIIKQSSLKPLPVLKKEKTISQVITKKSGAIVIPVKKNAPVKPQAVTAKTVSKPVQVLEKSAPVQVAKHFDKPITEPIVQHEELQTVSPIKKVQPPVKVSPVVVNKPVYESLLKDNFYTIGGIALGILLLLLLLTRKLNRNYTKQKEVFKNNLDEKPSPVTDYTEKITDDMTWKEKYQTYVDTVQTKPSEDINAEITENQELDSLFADNFDNIEENIPDEDISQYGFSQELFNSDEIEELLGEEDNEEKIDLVEDNNQFVEERTEEDEIIKSEFVIDDTKGFYLVDFEDTTALVGHIKDKIFVIKRFAEKPDGNLQARLNEINTNSASYMTKVGNFKALVEVTPDNMGLLIEL